MTNEIEAFIYLITTEFYRKWGKKWKNVNFIALTFRGFPPEKKRNVLLFFFMKVGFFLSIMFL